MQSKRVGFLITMIMMAALVTMAQAQRARFVSMPNEPVSDWFMNPGDNERGLQLNLKGRIELTPDYRDVATLSRNGFVRMRETRGSDLKRIEIETDKDGKVRRAYFVNDAAHEFDQEARLWLATVMRAAVREGGYEAPRRVAHLYQQGGADAVLAMIPLLKDDYGRRVYFEQLLRRHPLEAAHVPRVIQQIAHDLISAYEKREALNAVPRRSLTDAAVINELIAAAATLDSDHERGLMIAAFAQGDELTTEQLNGVLQLVGTLGKPYDRAEALVTLHRGHPQIAAQPAFFTAANGVGTAFEQSRVLLAVMGVRRVEPAVLKLAIESATHISQDYEMTGVLLRAVTLSEGDENLRQLIVAASKSIGTEYDRGRVQAALAR
jgi:hypothetical protein